MNKKELKIFSEICKMREGTLKNFLETFIKKYYPAENVHIGSKYIYVTGDNPIGLVAHLDTVHKIPPREIFFDETKKVIWSPQGIGADDRAGVYAIIDIVREGYRPTIIFCCGEEIGGVGAEKLITDFRSPLTPLNFLIELDRQGANDMVFYSCGNQQFKNYLKGYGFNEDFGSFSDISIIAPIWDIAAVNLSIGYKDEHTIAERLYTQWMKNTINRVGCILQDMPKKYKYIYSPSQYTLLLGLDENECDGCSRKVGKENLEPMKDFPTLKLCKKCREKMRKYDNT